MTVFEKIEAQQKGIENTAAWMVGEQLKDICAGDPHCAELVLHDLDDKDMSLKAAERKIKAYADKQKRQGNCVCVLPNVAEKIIREFFGLPAASAEPLKLVTPTNPAEPALEPDILDLSSFF